MERRFLDFLEIAPRSSKPRSRGLTGVNDQGYPTPWLREMLAAYSDHIDGVKFTPTTLPMPWDVIEGRVKAYRDYKVDVKIDDPIFAIAYYQGKADQLLRTLAQIGFTHVQIDTEHVAAGKKGGPARAGEDESRYMSLARELGLRVEGEVGKKWKEGDLARAEGGLLNVEAIVSETRRLLSAGCEKVYFESRVLREAIGDYGEKERGGQQVRQVVEGVGLDNIVFEVTWQMPWDTRQCHRFWLVRNFGPDVNIAGAGTIDEVRFIEAIRRGLTFVSGPSKASSKLWIKSLAKGGGKAAEDWWKEDYPIDPSFAQPLRS
ncbi:MAG: phosphosulfolactate synthase [Deltaproteobacteria bacterium]|nr:phosphosulfolactate synthase [Deltaproteobacteria bacterium]